jgi:lipoprotein-anchoring transpeptidase ErfK/SrfK
MNRVLVIVLAAAMLGLVPATSQAGRAPQARPDALASVAVVGSGPIEWERIAVRKAPSRGAAVVRTLTQFRPDFRPRWVLAVGAKRASNGRATWYEIALPGRPNGQRGWIPAGSVALTPTDRWLVVYRESRRFAFYVDGTLARTGRVAVGAPGMETPVGLFYVQSRFTPRRYPILGAFAFETSGYSKLSDWPGGGVVGVHGTPWPWLLGRAVSHGCVRLHNDDVLWLRGRMPLGTPIKIVAA